MPAIDNRNIKILVYALDDVLRNGLKVLLTAVFPKGEIYLTDTELDTLRAVSVRLYDLAIFYPGPPFEEQLCAAHKMKVVCPFLPLVLVVETQAQMGLALDAGVDRVLFKGFTMESLSTSVTGLISSHPGTPARSGRW